MKIIKDHIGKRGAAVTVVCCLHGDEIFGLRVFGYFAEHFGKYPGVQVVLANEPAIRAKKRFIEKDLNRCFPGSKTGSKEERLAKEILKAIGKTRYLLDVHTTTSDVKMVPIVASLAKPVKTAINLCASREVALMSRAIAAKSLIGRYADAAVSLEFNEKYARLERALTEVRRIVDGLLRRRPLPAKGRKIYHVNGVIGKNVPLPKGTANFKRINGLEAYPFLLHEKSYKDIHGFAAGRLTKKKI